MKYKNNGLIKGIWHWRKKTTYTMKWYAIRLMKNHSKYLLGSGTISSSACRLQKKSLFLLKMDLFSDDQRDITKYPKGKIILSASKLLYRTT